jgi:hypothetical protein
MSVAVLLEFTDYYSFSVSRFSQATNPTEEELKVLESYGVLRDIGS